MSGHFYKRQGANLSVDLTFTHNALMTVSRVLHAILVTIAFGRQQAHDFVLPARLGEIGSAGMEFDQFPDLKLVVAHERLLHAGPESPRIATPSLNEMAHVCV